MDLLFLMAHWHGLAKLRLHTDDTLAHLDRLTSNLGEHLRLFQKKTCSAFKTKELPRETRARNRKNLRQTAKKSRRSTKQAEDQILPDPGQTSKPFHLKLDQKSKDFNLHTYKNHSLGDYVEMIRKYGTVDSYSTEPVSFSHNIQVLAFIDLP